MRSRRAARRAGHSSAERNAIVVDRFFETKGEALVWAKQHPHFMTLRIVSSKGISDSAPATQTTRTTAAKVEQRTVAQATTNRTTAVKSNASTPAVAQRTSTAATPAVPVLAVTEVSKPSGLRNSVPSARTPDPRPVVSVAMARPLALASSKRFADNSQLQATANANSISPPSHYGRAVAYLP